MSESTPASGRLVYMVGLPYSGKTTVCREIYRPKGFAVVCPDQFRFAIHGQRFITSAEGFVWATVYAAVDALRAWGQDVVIDATNVSQKRRDPWASRGGEAHILWTSKEQCLARASAMNDMYIMPVIERMATEWDLVPEDRHATP